MQYNIIKFIKVQENLAKSSTTLYKKFMLTNKTINYIQILGILLWVLHLPIQICSIVIILTYPLCLMVLKQQNNIKDIANTQYFTKMLKNFAIIYGLSIYIFWHFIYDSAASLEPSQVNNLFTYSGFIPFLYITICNVMAYCELSKDDIIDVEIYKDVRDKSQAEQLKK